MSTFCTVPICILYSANMYPVQCRHYLFGTDVELKGVLCLRGVQFNGGLPEEDLITIVNDPMQLREIEI